METTENSIEVLNKLIKMNNDRIAGFKMVANDVDESSADLKALFSKFAYQSKGNVAELTAAVSKMGGEADKGSDVESSFHRAWIELRETLPGNKRKGILEECERGESAIKDVYVNALEKDNGLVGELSETISRQKAGIDAAYNEIKGLIDSAD